MPCMRIVPGSKAGITLLNGGVKRSMVFRQPFVECKHPWYNFTSCHSAQLEAANSQSMLLSTRNDALTLGDYAHFLVKSW